MDGVAGTILDVALGSVSPPTINVVHPRPNTFDNIISAVGDALVSEKITTEKLPLIPIQEWFSLLETQATGATDDDIKTIVSMGTLAFL